MPPGKKSTARKTSAKRGPKASTRKKQTPKSSKYVADSDGIVDNMGDLSEDRDFVVPDDNKMNSSSDFLGDNNSASTDSIDELNLSEGTSELAMDEERPVTPPSSRRASHQVITKGPITPSPRKNQKRVRQNDASSEENDVFVDSSATNFHKKPRTSPRKNNAYVEIVRFQGKSGGEHKKKLFPRAYSPDETESADQVSITHLEDLDPKISSPKLLTCQVFKAELEDLLLKGTYDKLTKLPGGKSITTWKSLTAEEQNAEEQGPRFPMFSTVGVYYPEAPIEKFKKILLFSGDKGSNFANLSRIDPMQMTYKKPNPMYKSSYICFRGAAHPARLLTMGLVIRDQTREPYQLPGPRQFWMKSLSIMPFALEFERNVAATCLIAGVNTFTGQITGNTLTFGTRQAPLDEKKSPSKFQPSPGKSTRTPILASPSGLVKKSKAVFGGQVSARSPNDDIPVLDGRGKLLKLPGSLKTIVEDLSQFDGSVPPDSLILVCYTNGGFTRGESNDLNMAHNIVWAVVLEGPDEDW
ncbi:hypothetical protein BDZ94DRAFT_1327626 [Collybia nuda]|uniref:Uncharacterized protein n=2 Tax=Collybia nuda TaxID=64659 RepID=A0A9P5XR14_9AGAR|nr:hypothetical protein BDZ94DRAFT_1327626 [Collybia nuda]